MKKTKCYIIVELYGGTFSGIYLLTRNEKKADKIFKDLKISCVESDTREDLDEDYEEYLSYTDKEEYYLEEAYLDE